MYMVHKQNRRYKKKLFKCEYKQWVFCELHPHQTLLKRSNSFLCLHFCTTHLLCYNALVINKENKYFSIILLREIIVDRSTLPQSSENFEV